MNELELREFKKNLSEIKYGKEFLEEASMISGLLTSMEENLKQILQSIENLKGILKPLESTIEIRRKGWE